MKKHRLSPIITTVLVLLTSAALGQDLDPPGPPGSDAAKMPSLRQIEPRTIIDELPYAISNSGSYVLVGDLTETNGLNGINVNVSDVTIDLNGFSLIGTPGSQIGINVATGLKRIQIKNGRVRNWGSYGIDAYYAVDGRYENLVVSTNGYALNKSGCRVGDNSIVLDSTFLANNLNGLRGDDHCIITRCRAARNTNFGITGSDNCSIKDSVVSHNGASGYYLYHNSMITGSGAFFNGGHGFYIKERSIVTLCTAGTNVMNGFNISKGSVISECTASGNDSGFQLYGALAHDCTAWQNTGDGFHCYPNYNSIVRNCTSQNNGEDGIDANTGSRVSNCLVSGHTSNVDAGIGAGAFCHIINNTIRGNYHGIVERGQALIKGNFLSENTYGVQSGSTYSSLIIGNIAVSNTVHFQTTSDKYGPVVTTTGVISNSNPYLNLVF